MPHGTPDWGLVGPKATTYGLDDLGEHAVRLGSPHLWDRRGDVIWMTDFRNGVGDILGTCSGAGCLIGLHTGWARQGAYCVLMQAGDDDEHLARLYKVLPLPVASGVGVEFSFSVGTWTEDWQLHLHWCNGVRWWETAVRHDFQNDRLEYLSAANVWTLVHEDAIDFNLAELASPMHVLKLVVDINLEQYVRVTLSDQEWGLAGVGARDRGLLAQRNLDVFIYHHSVATHVQEAFADSVIVTQNEP